MFIKSYITYSNVCGPFGASRDMISTKSWLSCLSSVKISKIEMREFHEIYCGRRIKIRHEYHAETYSLSNCMGHGNPVLHFLLPKSSGWRFMFFCSASELLYYAVVYKTTDSQDEESITHHTCFNLPKSEGINIHARCPLFLAKWLSTRRLELRRSFTDDGIKQEGTEIHGSVDQAREFHEKYHAVKTPTIIKTRLCILHGVKRPSVPEGGRFELWDHWPTLGYPSEHVKVINFISTCFMSG